MGFAKEEVKSKKSARQRWLIVRHCEERSGVAVFA